jgi:hypothetical protein
MRAAIIFLCGAVFALGVQALAGNMNPLFSKQCAVEHGLYDTTHDVDTLHRFKIGKSESLEAELEQDVLLDATLLNSLLKDKALSESDRKRINGDLRLISVMNEKFTIESWRSDKEFVKVLEAAQHDDEAHVAKLRCFDWSQPMWVGKPLC